MNLRRAIIPTLAVSYFVWTGAQVIDAGDDNELPVEYSYDTGSHTARVFAYCIGWTGIYLLGDTDEFRTVPNDRNCDVGSFLQDPDNDVELEER